MLAINETAASPTSAVSHPRVSGLDALKPADVQAIVRELNLPTPTPDVPLGEVLAQSGLTAADVWTRLERSTKLDVMIACAALRSGVVVLPRDQRLDPMPHRLRWDLTPEGKAGKPRPSSSSRAVSDPGMPPADHVVTHVGECGSAAGSNRARRFERYAIGLTVAELTTPDASGVKLKSNDIRRHLSEGRVTFGPRVVQ